jgi:LmbE family N-acetylglucosaminyl deacetylase
MPGGLLSIFAHPDDETFGVGGTMAHYRDRDVPVTVVSATRGEVGEIAPGTDATPETLGQVREQELRDACAILGVSDVRFLDFRDSGMAGTPENDDPRSLNRAEAERVIEPLVRIVRDVRPDVIATWDPSGGYGHPDHIAIHHHATAAYHVAADATRFPSSGGAWRTPALFYNAIPVDEFGQLLEEARKRGVDLGDPPGDAETMASLPRLTPNCVIDVSAQYERKRRALRAHRTQMSDAGFLERIPEDIIKRFFGREHFYRAHPELPNGKVLHDLLEDLA